MMRSALVTSLDVTGVVYKVGSVIWQHSFVRFILVYAANVVSSRLMSDFLLTATITSGEKGSSLCTIVVHYIWWAGFLVFVSAFCCLKCLMTLFPHAFSIDALALCHLASLKVLDLSLANCRYMRGRLTVEKVNAAINDTLTFAEANAQLITAPRKKVSLHVSFHFAQP